MSICLSWIPKRGKYMYVAYYAEHANKQALEYAASIVDKCSHLAVDNVPSPEFPYFRKHKVMYNRGDRLVSLNYTPC